MQYRLLYLVLGVEVEGLQLLARLLGALLKHNTVGACPKSKRSKGRFRSGLIVGVESDGQTNSSQQDTADEVVGKRHAREKACYPIHVRRLGTIPQRYSKCEGPSAPRPPFITCRRQNLQFEFPA